MYVPREMSLHTQLLTLCVGSSSVVLPLVHSVRRLQNHFSRSRAPFPPSLHVRSRPDRTDAQSLQYRKDLPAMRL